jgi:hypothetical protein
MACLFFNFAGPFDFGCCLPAQQMSFVALSAFLPSLLCASFQLAVYCSVFLFFFGRVGVSLPRSLCWFIPGVTGGILCDTWRSSVWSAKCLPSRFGAGVWLQQQPSYFLSVNIVWRSFPWARGSGCLSFDFFVLYFCQVWLQHLSMVFDSWSSCCLLLYPSHHLGSYLNFISWK